MDSNDNKLNKTSEELSHCIKDFIELSEEIDSFVS